MFSGTNLFLVGVAAVALAWGGREWWLWRNAREDPEAFVYPIGRLARRLGNVALLLVLLGVASLDPERMSLRQFALWTAVCFGLLGAIVFVAIRDLHESSISAVGEYRRFEREYEERMASVIREEAADRGVRLGEEAGPRAKGAKRGGGGRRRG